MQDRWVLFDKEIFKLSISFVLYHLHCTSQHNLLLCELEWGSLLTFERIMKYFLNFLGRKALKVKLRLMHDKKMRFVVSGVHLTPLLLLRLLLPSSIYFILRWAWCVIEWVRRLSNTTTTSNYGSDRSINPKKYEIIAEIVTKDVNERNVLKKWQNLWDIKFNAFHSWFWYQKNSSSWWA